MRRSLASLLFAVPVALSVGCAKADLDFVKIRVGMTKKDIIARVGFPRRTSVVNHADVFEYEAYDRYGALKVNHRSQFIRFIDDKVESFGNMEDLHAAKPPAGKAETGMKATLGPREAPAAPAAFDLRAELEKGRETAVPLPIPLCAIVSPVE